jgi:ribulose-5-phosphate 4-epimerase/fuculose-1-phosphate aldolase
MPPKLDDARMQLARANRILANEGVLDAFGHISLRHPADPKRYLLSRSRGPELVQPEDILEFDLDSEPIKPPTTRLYSERVIHGEIFKARPEAMAVCHHHAPSILPFCVSGALLKPVNHLGATMGLKVPVRDSRDEFGNTNLLVAKPDEGASLARALGPNWTVLMRRHGATVAGTSLEECVFRCIYTALNARMQIEALLLGGFEALNDEEIELAGGANLRPGPINRAWEYWSVRLDKIEGTHATKLGASAARGAARKKSTAKKSSRRAAKKRARRRR